ncbi:FU domain-containing protein T48 isoform X2 [Lasioglossum baleicum]|uniref:FU domain-containing protein T48 isoform X2 n=1 Tax=Lasioglossum baleicum TaxID=434251 RepID=UPI003FCC6297
MGNLSTVVKFSAVLFTCFVDFTWAENDLRVTECVEGHGGCKRCRDKICARCAVLLHRGTCVDSCPPGHIADWSTRDEYMGRICKETGYMFGFTGSQVAVLVGVISGATICILIILCGAIIVHRKKRRTAKFIQQFQDSSEHREFLKHLALLRGEGNTFLSMLNDTRRQVRELYYSGNNGDGAVGIQAYRPVLRDLARILVLVNRRDEEIPIPPDDWQRLFSWAERLLRRYKRHSSPEVAQLVTFLQEPPAAPSTESNAAQQVKISQSPRPYQLRTAATNLTTFQANIPLTTFQASDKSSISPASSSLGYLKDSPPSSSLGQNSSKFSPNGSSIGQRTPLVFDNQKQTKSSKAHLQELSVPTFNCSFSTGASTEEHTCGMGHCESNGLDPELNPQWEFHGSMEAANYTILSDWSPTREYLIDDFTILGFRPQDEITTEL